MVSFVQSTVWRGAVLCALIVLLLCQASTSAVAETAGDFHTTALTHKADPRKHLPAVDNQAGDVRRRPQQAFRTFRDLFDVVPLADGDVTTSSESGTSSVSTSTSTTTTTTTTTTSTTTTTTSKPTTTTPIPTTTTSSSRVPAPVTTQAPKVAQWTGISVAIVAVVCLILGVVLCKMKSKEQCCFKSKQRQAVVISPNGSRGGYDDKSPSEESLTSHGSQRSFHEAAVDESVPRRSLLHLHEDDASAGGESPSDEDEGDDGVYDANALNTTNHNPAANAAVNSSNINNFNNNFNSSLPANNMNGMSFTPAVSPPLPPIGYSGPAAPPVRPVSEAQSDWSPLASPGLDAEPATTSGRASNAPRHSNSGSAKARIGRSPSVSFSV